MSNPFSAPAPPGSGIKWQEVKGCLLLIEPKSFEEGIPTDYGESDAVRADIWVLDGEHPGDEYFDCLVFPKVLQGQLKRQIGQKVLGRVVQGQAKSNQSPPWMLAEASAEDQQTGIAFLQHLDAQRLAAPGAAAQQQAQPEPAPAPQPAQQQPAQQWGQPTQQQGGEVPF